MTVIAGLLEYDCLGLAQCAATDVCANCPCGRRFRGETVPFPGIGGDVGDAREWRGVAKIEPLVSGKSAQKPLDIPKPLNGNDNSNFPRKSDDWRARTIEPAPTLGDVMPAELKRRVG